MSQYNKLETARKYMALMADGINPVTNEYVSMGDTVFYEDVQDICNFVMEQMDRLILQHDKKIEILPLEPSDSIISMRELVRNLNSSMMSTSNFKFNTRKIEKWLNSIGAIALVKYKGVTYKKMTGYSKEFGVSLVFNPKSNRQRLQFTPAAQEYIYTHCLEIIE